MFKRIDKLKIDKQYRRKISFASKLKQVLFQQVVIHFTKLRLSYKNNHLFYQIALGLRVYAIICYYKGAASTSWHHLSVIRFSEMGV